MIPVLYIEETRDDSQKDWHFCIRYGGDDTYVVYGYRFNYGKDFYTKMTFYDRSTLSDFLRTACCDETSRIDSTLYFVNESDIAIDHFDSYYNLYDYTNELFGYDNCTFNDETVMKYLKFLRDMRMY